MSAQKPSKLRCSEYLLLMDDEGDVITRRHGQHLSLDAELQLSRWQQGAGVLLSALLFNLNLSNPPKCTSKDANERKRVEAFY